MGYVICIYTYIYIYTYAVPPSPTDSSHRGVARQQAHPVQHGQQILL